MKGSSISLKDLVKGLTEILEQNPEVADKAVLVKLETEISFLVPAYMGITTVNNDEGEWPFIEVMRPDDYEKLSEVVALQQALEKLFPEKKH